MKTQQHNYFAKIKRLLAHLRNVANPSPSLHEEYLTFQCAVDDAIDRMALQFTGPTLPSRSPEQWELMQCARIAITNFPEEAKAMRQTAGEAMWLVKQVIRSADLSRPLDDGGYLALERRINELSASVRL